MAFASYLSAAQFLVPALRLLSKPLRRLPTTVALVLLTAAGLALAAAEAAGFAAPLFHLASAYRPDARQQTLYARALKRYGSPQEARKWVAAPGGSSHRTGRALDVHLGMENDSKNVAALAASEPGKWLRQHAASFGFALYDAEPWHIEFNPEKT